MGYSRVPTPEPRAYARPTALREGADDGTYIANADLPHHPIDPYESCEPLVLVLLVPDITRICSISVGGKARYIFIYMSDITQPFLYNSRRQCRQHQVNRLMDTGEKSRRFVGVKKKPKIIV